ncbi:MAG: ribonuclease Z [Pyrinomonadaceae bacterium]
MSSKTFFALGTASQVPTRERNHNGYFIRWENQGFLFDPGEGTQRQMIFAGVSASSITKIFITHFHGDHCLGLPGILQRLSLDKIPHTVELYYPAIGKKYIENLKNASIYHNVARITEHPIFEPGVIFRSKKTVIETRKLDHSVECWGYRIKEVDSVSMDAEKLEKLGIRGKEVGRLIEEKSLQVGKKLIKLEDVSRPKKGLSAAFIMDTRMCDGANELAEEADFLICESTYLSSETSEAVANGHLTAKQAARIARNASAKQLVLTHFSQRYPKTEDFLAEAKKIFPDVVAARDGDKIDIVKK